MTTQVDVASCRVPVVDVIQAVAEYPNRKQAVQAWIRVHKKEPSLLQKVGEPIQVNGKGQHKHCADAETLHKILAMIPNNTNVQARRQMCKHMISWTSVIRAQQAEAQQPVEDEFRDDNQDGESDKDEMDTQGEGVELNNRAVVQRPGYVCLQQEDGSSGVYIEVTYQTIFPPPLEEVTVKNRT